MRVEMARTIVQTRKTTTGTSQASLRLIKIKIILNNHSDDHVRNKTNLIFWLLLLCLRLYIRIMEPKQTSKLIQGCWTSWFVTMWCDEKRCEAGQSSVRRQLLQGSSPVCSYTHKVGQLKYQTNTKYKILKQKKSEWHNRAYLCAKLQQVCTRALKMHRILICHAAIM